MMIAHIRATFPYHVETVWRLVTSNEQCARRRDLSRIEVLDGGRRFIEYTKSGYATVFTITVFEPLRRYAFELENGNMKGRWRGVFSYADHQTTLDLIEEVTVKKALMRPFAGIYLKRQQARYIADLRRELGGGQPEACSADDAHGRAAILRRGARNGGKGFDTKTRR